MPDVSPSPWGTGRSLYEIPPVMIAAARERSMVLIELCAVVPFERMIEDFHELLVRQRMGTVRAAEPVWQELMGTVLQEQGLNALLDVTARLAGCPASFLDTDDVLVARSRIATAAESGGPTEFEVRGPHAGLGRLVLDGRMNRHRTWSVSAPPLRWRSRWAGPPPARRPLEEPTAWSETSSPGSCAQRRSSESGAPP